MKLREKVLKVWSDSQHSREEWTRLGVVWESIRADRDTEDLDREQEIWKMLTFWCMAELCGVEMVKVEDRLKVILKSPVLQDL